MEKMNIEIKETGKEMPQRFREFFEAEIAREEFMSSNNNPIEKETKRILTWIASVKQKGNLIIATLERLGDATFIHIAGCEKVFSTYKNIDKVKAALEYIRENVCGEGCAIKSLELSRMSSPKKAYTVKIEFES